MISTWKIPRSIFIQFNLRNSLKEKGFPHYFPLQIITYKLDISWMKAEAERER